MRHHSKTKKFGRERNERTALMRSLAVALILEEKIKTTVAKAKAIRPIVEKMVTIAKGGSLSAQRLLVSRLGGNETAAKKLMTVLAKRHVDRLGGYTRIVKLPPRQGDASPMAYIEFV
ncbi:MAG: 50S ribosomal protein L17 [Candidatus Vogelbacteria bacterium]|nr:50S ribosomal protein L17 [Candidatus Vogelbacteria bacterium]